MFLRVLSVASALSLAAIGSQAATLSGEDLLKSFNTIALGHLLGSSETEGTAFVGGNLVSSGYTVYTRTTGQVSLGGNTGALFVGGSISGGNVNVNNGGNVVVGGTATATINRNGGGTLTTGATIPVLEVGDALLDLSQYLTTFATTAGAGISTADPNQKTITGGTGGTGILANIAVLNLTEAQGKSLFEGGTLKTLSLSSPLTLILNVAGLSHKITGNFNQDNTNVLVNFHEATKLSIESTFGFGILAPFADISAKAGGNDGVVVGNNITQKIEFRPLNLKTFTGDLPDMPQPPAPIPVPAAGLLLVGGLGALVALRRRAA